MIQIFINNEQLDLEADSLVTFKKSQQLNGIQEQYSYSNNFTAKNSAKNRRLLGINYLPNSKARGMTIGYTADVVINGCIFLKGQQLKLQKEEGDRLPLYLIFTDSYFVAKAKNLLMSQIDTQIAYDKTLANFLNLNQPNYIYARTAPVSAQDSSGFIVVEEHAILINVKQLIIKLFEQLGYAITGDVLTDTDLAKYYTSTGVGWYGLDGAPQFDENVTVYDFLTSALKTFNGYIEVSDSSRAAGLFLWKNIEGIKSRFVDYSDKFVEFKEYTAEGGLAKINTVKYAESPDFYNGFFNNNKSIIDKKEYLASDFGAGNLRLFGDQDLEDNGTLPPRTVGEITEPQTMNLFKFEDTTANVPVYYNGVLSYENMYRAVSPNILEIWQIFHEVYCRNIALPTVAQLKFRYDAVMLASFKMQQVFFVKQLSTYWLPMELNFTTKKDEVRVKALMIEKTPADVPVVFDQNLKVDFYGEVHILDKFALYAAYNVSTAATMLITAADLTKNEIYINNIQVLAFPTSIDVSAVFDLKILNTEPVNVLSNSDILFKFISAEGGVSREATINVAHNGRANFLSEFRSAADVVYTYGANDTNGHKRSLNYSAKITTPINIVDTFAPQIGDAANPITFKVLEFDRDSMVDVELAIGHLYMYCSNRGGGAEARTKIFFNVYKNGNVLLTPYSNGVIDRYKSGARDANYYDVGGSASFSALAGDVILIEAFLDLSEEDRIGSGTMDGSVSLTNVVWKFRVSEQI